MPANEEDRRVRIASGHFGDDIPRTAVLAPLADEREMHGHRLSALQDPDELFGIGNCKRASRDGGCAVGEVLDAGMRVAAMVGPDGPDHDGKRALPGSNGWSLASRSAELAITRPVLRRHHVMVDEDDLAFDGAVRGCPQRIDTVEVDDLPGYAGRTGRTAIAQRSDGEFLRKGRDDLGGLGAAGP